MVVIPFSPRQIDVLRHLVHLWTPERFILIGAAALGCFLDMRWRGTADLDLALAISLEEFLDEGLVPGWRRDLSMEHRWYAPGGEMVDIIPAGPELLRIGEVRWPRTGHRMSLVGLRLAFERGVPVPVAPDLTVRVSPVPVLAVLKIVAYQDRPAERERDLADLAYVFTEYEPEDRFADDVIDSGMSYDEVGPFLLARTIAGMVKDAERVHVNRFVCEASDEWRSEWNAREVARVGAAVMEAKPRRVDAVYESLSPRLSVIPLFAICSPGERDQVAIHFVRRKNVPENVPAAARNPAQTTPRQPKWTSETP